MKFFFYAFIVADFVGFYYLYQFAGCVQCLANSQALFFVGATISLMAQALIVAIAVDIEERKHRERRALGEKTPKKSLLTRICEAMVVALTSIYVFSYVVGGGYFGLQGLRANNFSMEQDYNTIEIDKWNSKGEKNG